MAKKPNIRFAGFEDDWEQRKLGELGEILTGSTPSTSNSAYYSEDGIPWVTPTDINELTISDTPRKLSEEGAKVGRVVPANTILCTCIASIGKNTLLTVKGSFNQQINSLTPYDENDAYFLLTDSEIWSNTMKRMAASGTMQIVNKTEFSELKTMVPSLVEQQAIGTYFHNLDHLITLHQRKCDELKKVKKFMLQKMFPKKGEKNPEIRFDGFTNDWEQRKLGEVCVRVTRKNKNNESDLPLTIASQYGLIDQRDFFNKVIAAKDMSNYYLLKKGEFAYNKSYSKGFDYGSIKRLNVYEQGCLSTLYICFSIETDEVDSDYLECFFDTLSWYHDVSAICAEGARNHGLLNVDVKAFFKDVNIEMPSQIQEQRKISVFINTIDHLITLHQCKCKSCKKYYKCTRKLK
ncbi:MAG: restriction endonuclease subunit S [Clostridium sp.]|nr:restriction endonuclease subunit S [Clostridium sp.]